MERHWTLNRSLVAVAALAVLVTMPVLAQGYLPPGAAAANALPPSQPATVQQANVAQPDPCHTEHWPFYSAGCLRGAPGEIPPRQVTMNVEPADISQQLHTAAATQRKPQAVAAVVAAQPRHAKKVRQARNNHPPGFAIRPPEAAPVSQVMAFESVW